MNELLEGKPGDKLLVLGNEAVVRGAFEGGVGVATTYPGTPSSEIGNTLYKLAKPAGMYFEFSINEKVALETAIGAAFAGVRSLTFMKHVGLNVAADPFMTYAYIGAPGGHVILSADDPSCHSSQNEQDNRYYALMANIPMLEPASPQEAKDMVVDGLELSEQFQVPVLLRTTTRLNHARGVITLEPRREPDMDGFFEKNPPRFVNVPAAARRNHIRLLELMTKVATESETSNYNRIEDRTGDIAMETEPVGIVTSGVAYNYVVEALDREAIAALVFKLGMTHPLPEEKLRSFFTRCSQIIVVEELEPYLETQLKSLAKDWDMTLPILGKRQGILPYNNELNDDLVAIGLKKALAYDADAIIATSGDRVRSGVEDETDAAIGTASETEFEAEPKPEPEAEVEGEAAGTACAPDPSIPLPTRPPTLCPGCGHRAAYYAAKQVGRKDAIYSSDIGCYTLSVQPPLETADTCVCMGASASIPGGFSKVTDQKLFSFVGDSTFFHTGIPGLINAVHNRHEFVYVILDNRTTAMTGHQPHPGLPVDGMGDETPAISIEAMVRACGVEFVRVVDPFDLDATKEAYRDAFEHDGVAVVIARHPCYLKETRAKRHAGEPIYEYRIDQEKCTQCMTCIERFGCPAFFLEDDEVHISPLQCGGCGVCLQVCPFGAIEVVK